MPVGSVSNFIILDSELLGRRDIGIVEKVVYAYFLANAECEPESLTFDFCARYLDFSESEVRRAWQRLVEVGLVTEGKDDYEETGEF